MLRKEVTPPSLGSCHEEPIGDAIRDGLGESQRQEIADALDGVYAESEERLDLGVGAVWRPEAGGGTRPSSILVRNCHTRAELRFILDRELRDRCRRSAEPRHPIERDAFRLVVE